LFFVLLVVKLPKFKFVFLFAKELIFNIFGALLEILNCST